MPEAAEVETLRRQLTPLLPFTVDAVTVRGHRSVRAHSPAELQGCVGMQVTEAARRGKWLGLTDGTQGLRVHLRMSGRLHLVERAAPLHTHDHVVIDIFTAQGPASLRFFDPRTFGEVATWDGGHLGSGAPDVLDATRLLASLQGYESRRSTKAVLLDQRSVVQGLGNIYADEVCHLARIDPASQWSQVTAGQRAALAAIIPAVIEDAVAHRGTALADEGWLDLHAVIGGHAPHLHVHARQQCADCAGTVERRKVAGRSTYACRTCMNTA